MRRVLIILVGTVVACSSKTEPSRSAPGSGSAPSPDPAPAPVPAPAVVVDAARPQPPAEGVAILPSELDRGFGSAEDPVADEPWTSRLITVKGFVRVVARDDAATTSDLRFYVVWIADSATDRRDAQVACEIEIESKQTLPPIPQGAAIVAAGVVHHGLDAPRLARCSISELDGKPSTIKSFGLH